MNCVINNYWSRQNSKGQAMCGYKPWKHPNFILSQSHHFKFKLLELL